MEESDNGCDYKGQPGWNKVDEFADALLNTHGLCLSDKKILELRNLYSELNDYDKKPIRYALC